MADLTSTSHLTSHTAPMCSTCNTVVHTQFASPHLIEQIVYDGLDPATDPAWETSGAATVEDYGRWCGHLCGAGNVRRRGPRAPHHRPPPSRPGGDP
ncbi:hypothetical protein [Streptomyces sp. A5-4]|uniref:hypothetical protein n=1 Tax=Streptomyces sp. A5-4 TaxID=3384771 RepID=UPI003DA95ABC